MCGVLCETGAVMEHLMSSRFLKLPTVWWATLEAGQSGVGSRTTSLSPILACSTECKLHHHLSGRHAVTKAAWHLQSRRLDSWVKRCCGDALQLCQVSLQLHKLARKSET